MSLLPHLHSIRWSQYSWKREKKNTWPPRSAHGVQTSLFPLFARVSQAIARCWHQRDMVQDLWPFVFIHLFDKYLLNLTRCQIPCYPFKFCSGKNWRSQAGDVRKRSPPHLWHSWILHCIANAPQLSRTSPMACSRRQEPICAVIAAWTFFQCVMVGKSEIWILKVSLSTSTLIPEFHYGIN